MSLLDSILGAAGQSATVSNLAAKVGLSPDQVERAIVALGQAHTKEGDTIQTAAKDTGLPDDKLSEIVGHIGGEGSLGHFASALAADGEGGAILGKLKNLF